MKGAAGGLVVQAPTSSKMHLKVVLGGCDLAQYTLKISQGCGFHRLSGQPVPGLNHSGGEKFSLVGFSLVTSDLCILSPLCALLGRIWLSLQ